MLKPGVKPLFTRGLLHFGCSRWMLAIAYARAYASGRSALCEVFNKIGFG